MPARGRHGRSSASAHIHSWPCSRCSSCRRPSHATTHALVRPHTPALAPCLLSLAAAASLPRSAALVASSPPPRPRPPARAASSRTPGPCPRYCATAVLLASPAIAAPLCCSLSTAARCLLLPLLWYC
ncbi:hypothetical protein VPH35_044501 [Triticum aestivum]